LGGSPDVVDVCFGTGDIVGKSVGSCVDTGVLVGATVGGVVIVVGVTVGKGVTIGVGDNVSLPQQDAGGEAEFRQMKLSIQSL
jgi:hypothetical protein